LRHLLVYKGSTVTIKLTICIATYNRARLLQETIESIIPQLTDECELVISDNASTDETERVVSEYTNRISCLRYHRQEVNQGLDRNFDCAVEYATGEYCWLFGDDDVFKPDAIATVLSALRTDFSLVLVNYECRDFTLSKVLNPQLFPGLTQDRVYTPDQIDDLFSQADSFIFIGCIIIKRSIWLSRERSRYHGSLFAHLGVIFQDRLPGNTLIVAKTCVSYRENYRKTFVGKELFEAGIVRWPALIATLAISDAAKRRKISTIPSAPHLLFDRAMNVYCLALYQRYIAPRRLSLQKRIVFALIAATPVTLVNTALIIFYRWLSRNHKRKVIVWWLRHSDVNLLNRWQFLRSGRTRDAPTGS